MRLGEIQRGILIGYKTRAQMMWCACLDCGKERWCALNRGEPIRKRCPSCANKLKTIASGRRKYKNCTGRVKHRDGYILVLLRPDDFFYPMADKRGYVSEHRLVMAKSLGRNLHRWEIVHHKNHIRNDNRRENLQLVSDDRHNQITILENRIAQLEKRVILLEAENIALKQLGTMV